MRVLVTGGAGFIGSHLVDRLILDGYDVRVLDDFSTGTEFNLGEALASGKLEIVRGSVLNHQTINRAMDGVQAVFHLAVECVRRSLGDPITNHAVNATGTLYTLEAARRHAVDRFVYCSSSEVYGNTSNSPLNEKTTVCSPVTVYGAAKLAGELYSLAYWQTYKLPVVVVRPFNSYGPREHHQGDIAEVIPRFFIRVMNGVPPIVFGDGAQGRDFTYVEDTARGISAALCSDAIIGRVLNLGTGRLVTIRELAYRVMECCGRDGLGVKYLGRRPGDVYRLTADTNCARELLNFAPRTELREGLKKYLQWFDKHYPDPGLLLEDEPENWNMPGVS